MMRYKSKEKKYININNHAAEIGKVKRTGKEIKATATTCV